MQLTHTTTATIALAVVAVLTAVGTAAGAGAATAQSDRPTVRVTEATATGEGTTAVGVVLTAAPDGLAGYYLDLSVDGPDGARIVGASYPEQFGLTTDPAVADDGGTVTLEAADLEGAVEPGATDVRLATVELSGATPDDLALAVEPRQFDADDGSTFEPAQQAADGQSGEADDQSGEANAQGGEANVQATTTETATGGSGPLSPVLVVVALCLLAAVGRHRRRGSA